MPEPGRLAAIRRLIQEAELGDAEHCAPRELALARAHLAFARIELEQGDISRAQEHITDGELNAEAAQGAGAGSCHRADLRDTHEVLSGDSNGDRDHDGVADHVDLCPSRAEDLDGYVDRDGCPDADNDGDSIADDDDQCPNEAEDRDGFKDHDGCPELDNDEDGVPDIHDACPLAAGDYASASRVGDVPRSAAGNASPSAEMVAIQERAADGCPSRYPGLVVTATGLVLSPSLSLDRGAETLSSAAIEQLSSVVQALKDHAGLKIAVQAHTDSRGNDDENLALSQRQAAIVVAYLSEQGIGRSRLHAVGLGETRPVESNRTSQGRQVNRRIEFLINAQMANPD